MGREVSTFVKNAYPKLLSQMDLSDLKQSILRAVSGTVADLVSAPFDINFSGTTFVSVIIE